MSEVSRIYEPETEPQASHADFRWMGMVLEAAGGMGFGRNEFGKLPVVPYVKLEDNNASRVHIIKDLFGGRVRTVDSSTRWTVYDEEAIYLANAIVPFAPSRRVFARRFNEWQDADLGEKLEIGSSLKARARSAVSVEEYLYLLENPSSLAGLFDARGKKYKNGRANNPQVLFTTKNRVVLEALLCKYSVGSNLFPSRSQDKMKDWESVGSFTLRMTSARTISQLTDTIAEYVKFPDKLIV
jgi:hypothetical protein